MCLGRLLYRAPYRSARQRPELGPFGTSAESGPTRVGKTDFNSFTSDDPTCKIPCLGVSHICQPSSRNTCRSAAGLPESGPNSATLGPILFEITDIRPTLTWTRPILGRFDRTWPGFARNSTKFGATSTARGPDSAGNWQGSPKLGVTSADAGPDQATCWAACNQRLHNFGGTWPKFDESWPGVGQIRVPLWLGFA